jgi:4,5-DOPA dioxygenase extradiol
MPTMPALFLSHGSPLHAAGGTRASRGWAALGARLPRPAAVLVASAHWETELPMVSTAERPETIHDFGGFPPPLYAIEYRAPGAAEVGRRATALLAAAGLPATTNACRGLDHGAWVPLRHLWPDADVPVAQLSIQAALGAAHHLRLGRALAPLRAEGVLVLGSGQLTHNLHEAFGAIRAGTGEFGADTPLEAGARAFSDWMDAALRDPDGEARLLDWRREAPHARRAHPTEEHLLPLFVALGAAGPRPAIERLDFGAEAGVLAMDGYLFCASAAR